MINKELSNEQLGWVFGIPTFLIFAFYFFPDYAGDMISCVILVGAFFSLISVISERKKWGEKIQGVGIILICLLITVLANYLNYIKYKHH